MNLFPTKREFIFWLCLDKVVRFLMECWPKSQISTNRLYEKSIFFLVFLVVEIQGSMGELALQFKLALLRINRLKLVR